MKTEMSGGYDGEIYLDVYEMQYGSHVSVTCERGEVTLEERNGNLIVTICEFDKRRRRKPCSEGVSVFSDDKEVV